MRWHHIRCYSRTLTTQISFCERVQIAMINTTTTDRIGWYPRYLRKTRLCPSSIDILSVDNLLVFLNWHIMTLLGTLSSYLRFLPIMCKSIDINKLQKAEDDTIHDLKSDHQSKASNWYVTHDNGSGSIQTPNCTASHILQAIAYASQRQIKCSQAFVIVSHSVFNIHNESGHVQPEPQQQCLIEI